MHSRQTLLVLLLAALFSALGPASAQTAPRPNILYVYVDDMGWGAIGPNGQAARALAGDPHVLTPNIDALAAQGVNFTRGYGCTVCSPARSSQQSGFHQGHTYADRNNTDNARKAMRTNDILIGDALSAAGYNTGYWGKWGYGASSSQPSPVIQNEQTLPSSHGYDHILCELHHVRAHTFFQPTLWKFAPGDTNMSLTPNSVAAYANNPAYPNSPANQDDPAYPSTAYCDDSYAFAALDFVRSQGQIYNSTGQPFFGLLAFQVPHTPLGEIATLPDWDQDYAGNTPFTTLSNSSKQWAAMVTRIDGHIGNLLAALEDPNNDGDTSDSIAGNTLVIFQSDNGGQGGTPRTELDINGGLRGSKGNIWDGGIRVPLVMRWPDQINATSTLPVNTSSDLVIDVTDLLPTFCDLAGTDSPLGIDGVSLAPTLTGDGDQRHRDFIIHEAGSNHAIIRDNFKLVGPSNQLYDLAADHDESNDISGANPALVAELSALMLGERVTEPAWFANTYHHWTGADTALTSDANNWSDYTYENAGITYMTDTGAPQLSWTALMENTGATPNTATADANLDFLGLEIKGASPTATQTLNLSSHTLTARNELRLSEHSAVLLDNGTIDTLRWIDLRPNASLTGAGIINGNLENSGHLDITQASDTTTPGPDITVPGPDISITDGHEFITNGGFENGSDTGSGDYSYDTLTDWFTSGPDGTKDAAKPNNSHTGTYRGLANTGYPLVQTTAFPFILGDSYTLSFQHRGFSGWTTGELARIRVFYENPVGTEHDVFSTTLALTNGTWNLASFNIPALADANAVGKAIQVSLGPDTGTGFHSFDAVSLTRHGPATTIPGPDVTQPGPDIVVPGHRRIDLDGNCRAFPGSKLSLSLAGTSTPGEDYAQLNATGTADLAGTLAVNVDPSFDPAHNDSFTILTASAVNGTFDNANNEVIGNDGTRFNISYSATTVTLTAALTTAQGTPFSWLESFGIDGGDHEAADLLDHDGDGALAWEEFLAGTDPTDPSSRFASTVTPGADYTSLTLTWPSISGRTYHIEHSDSLTGFLPYTGPLASTPPENSYLISPLPSARDFFRVSVTLE